MLFLRVAFLAGVILLHVIGGAVLFRKLFPRESPWWGFFIPILAIVSLLNFFEHAIALPGLFLALPFSSACMILLLARSRHCWRGLLFPTVIFTVSFLFCLMVKCLEPTVNFWCTEGLTDLNRILDFCLGDTVPPRDCWLPPYPHTGYYTFMHYGASVLKRLLSVDIGTAYNLSSALVSALTLMAGGAAAHSLGRQRSWITVITVLMLAGGFTGSTPIHAILNPNYPNPAGSIDIGNGTDYQGGFDKDHSEFGPLLRMTSLGNAYRIYTPGCFIYYSEFHANMAGHLIALLTVFAAVKVLRRKRSYFPWIFLPVAPLLAFISCTWFVFIVGLLAGPTLIFAWAIGRRPPKWPVAVGGAVFEALLLWPTLQALLHNSTSQGFFWSDDLRSDLPSIAIQWWPVYLPWLLLCFVWKKLDLTGRWLHFWLLPIALSVELFFFSERGTMMEKTLGGAFGVGVVVLYPLLFAQRDAVCRTLSAVLMLCGFLSFGAWTCGLFHDAQYSPVILHLEGDSYLTEDAAKNRIMEVLNRVHGQTVLAGKARVAWFDAPTVAAFTENRCYLGWTNAEESCGYPDEAHARQKDINDFYAGTMADPLGFLQTSDITAVLVWPTDKMSNDWLQKMKAQLAPEYTYFDCQIPELDTAGVFLKKAALPEDLKPKPPAQPGL